MSKPVTAVVKIEDIRVVVTMSVEEARWLAESLAYDGTSGVREIHNAVAAALVEVDEILAQLKVVAA
jgi:hypothetical protein